MPIPIFSAAYPILTGSPAIAWAPLLIAALTLYNYDSIDPLLRVRDTPSRDIREEYDFIIVGGGTAGSVLASRLSEIAEWSVLLLEAGGDETALSEVPWLYPNLTNTNLDWQFKTEPSRTACLASPGRRCEWPRGKVLGGTSSINDMLYNRGNRRDYDQWESFGNPGWNFEDALYYFKKSEDMRIPELQNDPYHSTGGPLTVNQTSFLTPLVDSFLAAFRELGYPTRDINGESAAGFMIPQVNTRDGHALSTARAFLRPARNRPNLDIALRSFVTRVLIDADTRVAYGVEFKRDDGVFTATARREVIVSAGAIQSPQLLMLSGIGPAEDLEDAGIRVLQDLNVGGNLQDHVVVPGIRFTIDQPILSNNDRLDVGNAVFEYARSGSGILSRGLVEVIGNIFSPYVNTTDYPDVQVFVTPKLNINNTDLDTQTLGLLDDLTSDPESVRPLALRNQARRLNDFERPRPFRPPANDLDRRVSDTRPTQRPDQARRFENSRFSRPEDPDRLSDNDVSRPFRPPANDLDRRVSDSRPTQTPDQARRFENSRFSRPEDPDRFSDNDVARPFRPPPVDPLRRTSTEDQDPRSSRPSPTQNLARLLNDIENSRPGPTSTENQDPRLSDFDGGRPPTPSRPNVRLSDFDNSRPFRPSARDDPYPRLSDFDDGRPPTPSRPNTRFSDFDDSIPFRLTDDELRRLFDAEVPRLSRPRDPARRRPFRPNSRQNRPRRQTIFSPTPFTAFATDPNQRPFRPSGFGNPDPFRRFNPPRNQTNSTAGALEQELRRQFNLQNPDLPSAVDPNRFRPTQNLANTVNQPFVTLADPLNPPADPNRVPDSYSVGVALLRPKSRGRVMLSSNNPYDYPILIHNYFTEPLDMFTMIEGLKTALGMSETNAMQQFRSTYNYTNPNCANIQGFTDAYWECVIRYESKSGQHQAGTCKMGPYRDPDACVDNELRVYGIEGLRVVGSAIMPTITSGNKNAPTIMIAEKAADLIKDTYGIPTGRPARRYSNN